MTKEELYEKALEAMQNSYSPYSNFKVGAALLTKSGEVFTGCNIENASYGAAICAERTAFVKAISEGFKEIDAIAVCCDHEDIPAYPCGICRQFMYEFGDDIRIILKERDGLLTETTISKLLPKGFRL
ncbi:MAG: cytidine deaminase [Peptostreptococcales bacterium]